MINESNEETMNKKDRDSLYREFLCNYWNDSIVVDDFKKNDKHLFAYLLTNTHSNLIQCYPISLKTISFETDFDINDIKESIKHLEELGFIKYDNETKEILLLKYVRENWSTSEKYIKGLNKQLNNIKSKSLISELSNSLANTRFIINNHINTLCIGLREGMDNNDIPSSNDNDTRRENKESSKSEKEDRKKEKEKSNSIEHLGNKELKKLAIQNSLDLNGLITFYDKLKVNNFLINESGEYIDSINSLVAKYKETEEYERGLL